MLKAGLPSCWESTEEHTAHGKLNEPWSLSSGLREGHNGEEVRSAAAGTTVLQLAECTAAGRIVPAAEQEVAKVQADVHTRPDSTTSFVLVSRQGENTFLSLWGAQC